MALRKYNCVRGGESSNHLSNGFIIPRGSGTGGGGGGGGGECPAENPWFNGFYCTQYGECPEGYHLEGDTCVPDEPPEE